MATAANDLSTLRDAIVAALVAGDVKAVDYTSNLLNPPVAAVVPSPNYLTWGESEVAFAYPVRVRHDVLLLSNITGSREQEADLIDGLICKAVAALREHGVKRVSRPGTLTIDGTKYLGAVLSLEQDTPNPTTTEG